MFAKTLNYLASSFQVKGEMPNYVASTLSDLFKECHLSEDNGGPSCYMQGFDHTCQCKICLILSKSFLQVSVPTEREKYVRFIKTSIEYPYFNDYRQLLTKGNFYDFISVTW